MTDNGMSRDQAQPIPVELSGEFVIARPTSELTITNQRTAHLNYLLHTLNTMSDRMREHEISKDGKEVKRQTTAGAAEGERQATSETAGERNDENENESDPVGGRRAQRRGWRADCRPKHGLVQDSQHAGQDRERLRAG